MALNFSDIFKNTRSSIRLTDSSLSLSKNREQKVLEKKADNYINEIEPLPLNYKSIIPVGSNLNPYQARSLEIVQGAKDEEGNFGFSGLGLQGTQFQRAQLGGTITQHPEKQGFERGVTAAGFPTQEQMTGLGFRQGPASYKPQKYAHGEEVIQNEQPPIEQPPIEQPPIEQPPIEQLPTEQLPEEKNAAVQQMGNIEAAKEQGLSAEPELIDESQAAPPQQAADDVKKTVPEGSFVINSAAVKIAGLDYIEEIVIDALKVAVDKGINIAVIGGAKGKEAVNILISNGEVIIPPELVGIIGEHTLKLINDKGIAAMKKEEQLQQGPQAGQYGGAETPPPPQQAYGGFIDMKEGYASGKKVNGKKKSPYDPWIRKELYEGEIKFFKDNPDTPAMTTKYNKIILNPNPPKNVNMEAVKKNEFGRVLINTGKFKVPDFKLTDKQQEKFINYGTDKNIQDTIIARIV
ncbi:hypothetical protein CMI37_31510, partial [Candidatus Pacearchaeota archaeon]|nr:hypothetical protein [Candidatus Pacearchaeota archaeon]